MSASCRVGELPRGVHRAGPHAAPLAMAETLQALEAQQKRSSNTASQEHSGSDTPLAPTWKRWHFFPGTTYTQ